VTGAPVARRIVVHGRVQGVFFRATVRDAAQRAGAAGWASNRPDGSVEVHVEGSAEAVDAVEAAARRGPRGASVESVDVRSVSPEGLTGFETR
jgi:acylphosphatase